MRGPGGIHPRQSVHPVEYMKLPRLFASITRLRFSKLSARIASYTMVVTFILTIVTSLLLVPLEVETVFVVVLIAGAAAYVSAYRILTARIDLARSILIQIRSHQFDKIESVQQLSRDELSTLIWQIYRTGLATERELRELKKSENYRREFLGNVFHELKTPIFSIQGFAETLLDGALEDERVSRKFVEKILRNVHRLSSLSRDLSEISQLETGEMKLADEPFNIRSLIGEVVESLEHAARDRNITLHQDIPDSLPLAAGDRERIRQVLTNLIDNAIKYNDSGGSVNAVARQVTADEIEVSIIDDGIGIAPEHITRVTERFFRVDKSRSRDQGGTGLGLAIVKHILAAHGRKLEIESSPGRGSKFSFILAKADSAATRYQRVNRGAFLAVTPGKNRVDDHPAG